MKRPGLSRCFAALLLWPALAAQAAAHDGDRYRRVQASPHVHVFQSDTGAHAGNVVAVVGRDAVLIVDTGPGPEVARRAVAELRSITPLPVRYVVNTHYRGAHLLGNAVFKEAFPEAVFLAHGHTIAEATRFHASVPRSGDRMRRYICPDFPVDDEMRLDLGSLRVQVRHLGAAHTPGDLIVWVEADKLAATGELLVAPARKAAAAQMQQWMSALGKLRALDPRVIVPGHGPVISEDDEEPAGVAIAMTGPWPRSAPSEGSPRR